MSDIKFFNGKEKAIIQVGLHLIKKEQINKLASAGELKLILLIEFNGYD